MQQTAFIQVAEREMCGRHRVGKSKHLSGCGEPVTFWQMLHVAGMVHVVSAGHYVPQKGGLVAVVMHERVKHKPLAQLRRLAAVP